jgi:hypothetical protein
VRCGGMGSTSNGATTTNVVGGKLLKEHLVAPVGHAPLAAAVPASSAMAVSGWSRRCTTRSRILEGR